MNQLDDVVVGDLHRRQVDGDPEAVAPGHCVQAGALQHPAADRQDGAAFLGDGDEDVRGNGAARRMRPADEGLVADGLAGPDVLLHLIGQVELFPLERVPEIARHGSALARGLVHVGLVEADVLCHGPFGAILGQIGVVDQLLGVDRVVRVDGDADRHADGNIVLLDAYGRLEAALQAAEELADLRLKAELLERAVFVAADAPDELAVLRRAFQAAADLHENGVAGAMAALVVDFLELIEVETDRGKLDAVVGSPGEVQGKAIVELGTVRQAGEGVEARQIGKARLLRPALGHVLDGGDPASFAGDDVREGNDPVAEGVLARYRFGLREQAAEMAAEQLDGGKVVLEVGRRGDLLGDQILDVLRRQLRPESVFRQVEDLQEAFVDQ